MKIVAAKCPRSDADINIDKDSKIIKCEYCKTSLIIEDDKLEIQKIESEKAPEIDNYSRVNMDSNNNYKMYNIRKKNNYKLYSILLAIIIVIANIVSIKINWDYKNSLGSVIFLILGLLHITLIKESRLKEKALLAANVFGLIFFFVSLWVSLYIYNLLPGYVNKWKSDNIILDIRREKATIEFKDTGVNETIEYSSYPTYPKTKVINNELKKYTVIKLLDYHFVYSEDDKMCYADENDECIEELKIVK